MRENRGGRDYQHCFDLGDEWTILSDSRQWILERRKPKKGDKEQLELGTGPRTFYSSPTDLCEAIARKTGLRYPHLIELDRAVRALGEAVYQVYESKLTERVE